MGTFLHIAHRGYRTGLGDNTLAQLREAVRLGADMIEVDVRRRASDGELVLAHDKGPNEHAATLRQALALARHANIPLNLDLKQNHLSEQLVRELREAGMTERIVITGGGWEQALWIRHLEPRIRVGLTIPRRHHDWVRALGWTINRVWRFVWTGRVDLLLRATHADLVTVQYRLITPRLVTQVHRAGGEIWAWTPDDPDAIARLAAMGVDGICTNVPDPARAAVTHRSEMSAAA
ncbi:MAG: glycerophosphodiester phosphodiesterase [Gaiellales bacterium]